jgi:hypothetical protein
MKEEIGKEMGSKPFLFLFLFCSDHNNNEQEMEAQALMQKILRVENMNQVILNKVQYAVR